MILSLSSPRFVSHRRRNRLRLERKCRSRRSKTVFPATERILSPAPTPARSAAEPRDTDSTRTPAPSCRFVRAVRPGEFTTLRFMEENHYGISRAGGWGHSFSVYRGGIRNVPGGSRRAEPAARGRKGASIAEGPLRCSRGPRIRSTTLVGRSFSGTSLFLPVGESRNNFV